VQGDVIVIRYEGPRGNGMPEMYFASAVLDADPVLGQSTALVTDGRYSGAMKGPCIGHVSPEAADGGPIALVQDGDLIEINIPERKLGIVGLHGHRATETEIVRVLADRRARWSPPPPRHTSGILSLYGQVAGTASSGASLTPVSDHRSANPSLTTPSTETAPSPSAHIVTAAEAAAPVVSTDGAPPEARRNVKIVVLDYDFGEV